MAIVSLSPSVSSETAFLKTKDAIQKYVHHQTSCSDQWKNQIYEEVLLGGKFVCNAQDIRWQELPDPSNQFGEELEEITDVALNKSSHRHLDYGA